MSTLSLGAVARSLVACAAVGAAATASAHAESAYPSVPFVDSIGVNVKLSSPQTAYYNLNSADRLSGTTSGASAITQVTTLINDLGIKHIRNDLCDPNWIVGTTKATSCIRGLQMTQALANKGVLSLDSWFGNDPATRTTVPSPTEIDRQLALASARASQIDGFEGPNELDAANKGITDWHKKLAQAQATAASKAEALTGIRDIPRSNPSLQLFPSARTLTSWGGDTTYAAYSSDNIDAANIHQYLARSTPEAGIETGITNLNYTCVSGQPAWKSCGNLLAGGTTKPIWLTETGYTTASNVAEGINEQAAAIYLPRLLLEGWRQKVALGRGFDRTYLYELIDSREGSQCVNGICSTDRESGFGLVAANYARKRQYFALQRLLALVNAEPTSNGGDLNYTISQPDQSQVRRLLFQQANGHYVLALWRPVSVYNWPVNSLGFYSPGSSIPEGTAPNTTQNVTITLPSAMPATLYRPSLQDAATETRTSATTHTITVRGDVTLVKLG